MTIVHQHETKHMTERRERYNKGQSSTPDNPGQSPHMRWIRDHLDYPHADFCLIWPFPRQGYPSVVRKRKKIYVHRYICELKKGPPPTPGHQAAHYCNRGHEGCVNHHHLRWKTKSENQLEANWKGRKRYKLNEAQAAEIRSLKGSEQIDVTAQRFGVRAGTIQDIQAGRTWKSVQTPSFPTGVRT